MDAGQSLILTVSRQSVVLGNAVELDAVFILCVCHVRANRLKNSTLGEVRGAAVHR